jgi:hypothetical protein
MGLAQRALRKAARGWLWLGSGLAKKQMPRGHDNKKCNGKSKSFERKCAKERRKVREEKPE